MTRLLHVQVFGLLLALSALHCADDDPNHGPFDGNFIVGDGAITDRGLDLATPSDAADGGLLDVADANGPELEADAMEDLGHADVDSGDAEALDVGPDPCEVEPEETLTASAAIARGASLDGRIVEIEGELGMGTPSCTDRACLPEEPCCNGCFATLYIDEILPAVPSSCLPNVGCTGDECGLVCRPLLLGGGEVLVGRMRHEAASGSRLELIQLRRP